MPFIIFKKNIQIVRGFLRTFRLGGFQYADAFVCVSGHQLIYTSATLVGKSLVQCHGKKLACGFRISLLNGGSRRIEVGNGVYRIQFHADIDNLIKLRLIIRI